MKRGDEQLDYLKENWNSLSADNILSSQTYQENKCEVATCFSPPPSHFFLWR